MKVRLMRCRQRAAAPLILMLAVASLSRGGANAAPVRGGMLHDCPDCQTMVIVPAGGFDMGSTAEEAAVIGRPGNKLMIWERPRHHVVIGKPFALSRDPVTVSDYAVFARAVGAQVAGSGWSAPGVAQTPKDPVVKVSWRQAVAYTTWMSQMTGKRYRLPTEAEWEYTARGGLTGNRFWGDQIGVGNANCSDCGSDWDGKSTSPVDSFKLNPFGLRDMLGNVWEWTADCWNTSYAGAPFDGSAWMSGDCAMHPSRGGSWTLDSRYVRADSRARDADDYQGNMVGFRIARDLDEAKH